MKKLILSLLILSFVACHKEIYRSRVNPNYKPLTQFKTDSVAPMGSDTADYLHYNFIDHKDKYIGEKFSKLIRDLKINITQGITAPNFYDPKYYNDINLYFYDISYAGIKNGIEYYLYIRFQDKFACKEFDNIQRKSNLLWNKEHYEFLKNKIVIDVVLGDSRNWEKASKNQ